MTDIVQRLRLVDPNQVLLGAPPNDTYYLSVGAICHEAAAEIERLRAEVLAEPVEPVAWAKYDLDAMVEAFDRVIEAHFSKAHPFHDPTNMDAKMALRILRGLVPAMKAYTTPPQQAAPVEPVAWIQSARSKS